MKNVSPDFLAWSKMKTHFEGCRLEAYQDSGGVWTIGLGSTFNHNARRRVKGGDKIDMDTAIEWMKIDSEAIVKQANMFIKAPLSPAQSTAVCDYIYNRGIGNFIKTRLDDLINSGASDDKICAEMVGTGLKDRAGNLLWGLGRRRRSQAYLFKYGILRFDFPRWGKWE
jgi:lysozyme